MDLTSFYFSYTYNMTRTLQSNMTEQLQEADEKVALVDGAYSWLSFHFFLYACLSSLRSCNPMP
jgi:hypothetical protein